MSADLKRISRSIQQKQNVDDDLWLYFGQKPHPDPNTIFKSNQRALVVAALCSLLTTNLNYDMPKILQAVSDSGSNPKLAYTALTYLRLRVKPLSAHTHSAFQLLMMLDEVHIAKSPVNRLPRDLWFTSDQTEQLQRRFPTVQWQVKPAVFANNISKFDSVQQVAPRLKGPTEYVIVADVPQKLVRGLLDTPLTPPFKLLCQSRLHDKRAITALKKTKDWLLLAHCVSLWFSGIPEFMECPASYQFDGPWTQLINLVVPQLAKAGAFAVFEQPRHGLLVLWSFFTIVRPPNLPVFDTMDQTDRFWQEIFTYLFTNQLADPVLVKTSLELVSTKGQLLALDILMRTDRDPELANQFVQLYQPGLVDPEPVQALMFQRGLVKQAHNLDTSTASTGPNISALELSPEYLVRTIHASPVAAITPLLKRLMAEPGLAKTVSLIERLLPLINTLSVRGNGTMVKLEYASLALHALLMHAFLYLGFAEGAAILQQAGAAKASGLEATIWTHVFEKHHQGSGQHEPLVESLHAELQSICGFAPDPQEIIASMTLLRRNTRRNALLSTINDTVLTVPDLCGFKRKPRRSYDPGAIVDSWSALESPMTGASLQKNSQLVLDYSPLVGALGTDPNPWLSIAADNLRSPLLRLLHVSPAEKEVQNLSVYNDHVVVTLNFAREKSAVVVTRSLDGSSLTVQIPVHRPTVVGDEQKPFSLVDSLATLQGLIKKSTTLSRSQFSGSSDEWWRQQKLLGKHIKDCLRLLETRIFGGMVGLLSPISLLGTPILAQVRQAVIGLYSRYISVPIPILNGIRDEVVELFLEVAKQRAMGIATDNAFAKALAADLNGLVIDGLRIAGHSIDYDMVDIVDLEHAIITLCHSYQLPNIEQLHLVLVPGSDMVHIPWESFPSLSQHQSTSRCLSLWHYMDLVKTRGPARTEEEESDGSDTEADEPFGELCDEPIDRRGPSDSYNILSKNINYVLNPQNDLPAAEKMFQADFERWTGVCGEEPSERQILSFLQTGSCYIYIGHGAGYRYIRGVSVRKLDNCSAVMLFGCSSAKLQDDGSGPVFDHILAGCKLFIGFMWDIPNTDCNLFTYEFLKLCFEERIGVFRALKRARKVCRIYTTSMAPVIYGIP